MCIRDSYYCDEFHLLLKDEQTAAYSVEIWKRFRKWGGIPTGITQNVKDLLSSAEIENIFENSDYIYMLNQAQGDREILAKKLGISPQQLSYVTQSGAGEGLLSVSYTHLDVYKRQSEYTEAAGHKPSDWIIDTPATIEHGGSKHIECTAVSYTHLDVYKRQPVDMPLNSKSYAFSSSNILK